MAGFPQTPGRGQNNPSRIRSEPRACDQPTRTPSPPTPALSRRARPGSPRGVVPQGRPPG